jgi:hypothetical protein
MNPAVTLTFLRLGTICPWDALFFVCAQIFGGTAGVLFVAALFGHAFTDPPVSYAATLPGPQGPGVAFFAEVAATQASDVWCWQINLCASQLAGFEISLSDSRWQLVSGATELPQAELGWHSGLITRDPDGHASLIGEGTVCTRI